MTDLVLSTGLMYICSDLSYGIVPGQAGHPLFSGLTSPIAMQNSTYSAIVSARRFLTSPSTILAINVSYNLPTVLVRQLGAGKVVYLDNCANYLGYTSLADPNMQRLYLNALAW
jgi:hypothetical protein